MPSDLGAVLPVMHLDDLADRLEAFESRYEETATRYRWELTRET